MEAERRLLARAATTDIESAALRALLVKADVDAAALRACGDREVTECDELLTMLLAATWRPTPRPSRPNLSPPIPASAPKQGSSTRQAKFAATTTSPADSSR